MMTRLGTIITAFARPALPRECRCLSLNNVLIHRVLKAISGLPETYLDSSVSPWLVTSLTRPVAIRPMPSGAKMTSGVMTGAG
jgi:hypothetical protein